MTADEFTDQLAGHLAAELKRWHYRFQFEEVRIFDLGCFPDHGYLELSFLTSRETAYVRAHPSDIASWRLYDFAKCYHSKWPRAVGLMEWLKSSSESMKWSDIFRHCASAMQSERVSVQLSKYDLAPGFTRSVLDLESPRRRPYNYCTDKVLDWKSFVVA